jgi:DNA-binding response OmpR family regulator
MSKGKLFLVVLNPIEAERRRAAMEQSGWEIDVESDDHGRAYDFIIRNRPDLVFIDLNHQPPAARKVARSVRMEPGFEDLPILFVNGTPDERDLARTEFPNAAFATDQDLMHTLNQYAK